MKKKKKSFLFGLIIFLGSVLAASIFNALYAQTEFDDRAVLDFDQGIGFLHPDSLFGTNLRFRMQNRIGVNTMGINDFSVDDIEASVRRMRLRFDGFLNDERLTYYLQVSFSRRDQNFEEYGITGVLRDAMVFYRFSPSFFMGFGQGKLPGNRQRVISSGALQFTDRSMVNSIFNIDRDFGVMAHYESNIQQVHYRLRTAISSGEGRNVGQTDDGLAYTARFELLPLGAFAAGGDYFEGDLIREETPKLSLSYAASYNHKAIRSAGQRGVGLPQSQDIISHFADVLFKYRGWAFFTEYAMRSVTEPFIFSANGEDLFVYTGQGTNTQLSYAFPNLWEVGIRYTRVLPDNFIQNYEHEREVFTLGATRYIQRHRSKLQFNVSYVDDHVGGPENKQKWNFMVQIEAGI